MAVIGARPAQPWYLGWRTRTAGSARRRSEPTRTRSVRPAAAHRRRTPRVRAFAGLEVARNVRPLLMVIVLGAGLALFYLSQSTRVAATGYEIDALEATLAEQRAIQQQLITAIGQARSPAEITDRAQRELGLVPLDEAAVQFVTPSPTQPPTASIDD